ncbi:MAG: rhomboid family intramembrane serine protease [Paludibacter sp.]|nr:rhomboid family intramembrane serine protease [Paludibacter sp.]
MNSYRPSFLNSIPPVVKNLIAINIVLWLASIVVPGIFMKWGLNVDLTDILGLHYWESSKFNPAQLITYGFMHGGIGHIFFNMFALYMFGGVLEQLWGTKRFLFYYLLTGVGAGLVQELFWSFEFHSAISAIDTAISSNVLNAPALLLQKKEFLNSAITIGASGSVFGLLLAFGWLFPEVKLMMLFFPVPIKARIFVLIYGVAELFLGVAQFSGDNVAHFAHLGGMIFGAVLILIWKKKRTL